jgi:hypothetical protein
VLGINTEAGLALMLAAGQHHLTLPRRQNPGTKKKGVVSDAQIANTAASGCFLRGAVVGCVFAGGEADWKG